MTENFYKNAPWPDPETVVGPLVNDPTFLIFYTELYYRHLYALTQPSTEQHIKSYENYCKLFNHILSFDGPVDIELPVYWAWDIIDEFIYQFNTFCIYRNRAIFRGNNQEEVELMKSKPEVWGTYSVLNVLYSLAGKSKISDQLKAVKAGNDPNSVAGDYGSRSIYNTLGYFSLIGLLRVHTLLGDYSLALKTLEGIELNKKAFFTRVPAAHYTIYYYVGFCYLMLRRYSDAINSFSHVLLFISRTRNINRSPQFNAVSKKSDQMYALLAICVALNPTRIDATVSAGLREKYGEQLYKMQRGAINIFEELYHFAAPKFVSPSLPNFEYAIWNGNPFHFHAKLFLDNISNAVNSPSLKNYLHLYASMDISKLSSFLETTPEELRSILINFKLKNQQIVWENGDLHTGEPVNISDVNIVVEDELIHISESKTSRKFADWFMRNTNKNYVIQDNLSKKKKQEA